MDVAISDLYSNVCPCKSSWSYVDIYDVRRNVELRGFGAKNISVKNNSITVNYEVGSFDPSSMEILGRNYGGFGVKYFMGGYSCFVLRYNLELVGEFNYVLGGKLHGIYGGRGNSGGDRSDGYNGFSYRLIWGEDGRIYPYLYHYNMGQWGSKLGNGFKLINGVNNIQMAISLNKGSDFFSLIVNNDYYEKEDITFSKKVMPVSGIFFSTFFGGNEEKFGAKNTEKIIFSEFSYKGCKNESD